MSFNSRPDYGAAEARVDEINENAEEWQREHGDDWQPEPGPVRKMLDAVRARFSRDQSS
jgi:hypothetical protein